MGRIVDTRSFMRRATLFTLTLTLVQYAGIAAAATEAEPAASATADTAAAVVATSTSGAEDLPGAAAAAPAASELELEALAETDPFVEAIELLESSGGAYDPGLPEHLLSLGLALERAGRHEEAIKVFKRGAHLTRINNGLYGAGQIPLLNGEIRNRLALGQYAEADERQEYMYRVLVRGMGSGSSRATALMQQARWQYSAYQLGVGGATYPRLMNMWDLYRLALNDVIAAEGETSPALLPPLYGMLRAQYLIAGYQGDTPTAGFSSDSNFEGRQDLNRFYAYRAQSYDKGQAVIQAIRDLEREQNGANSVKTIEALVLLGDWFQWHGEPDDATNSYSLAFTELLGLDNAQVETDRIFGDPVPLPDVQGLRGLPPEVATGEGDILLEFGVTERGRVVDMERLDDNDSVDGTANRLMRKLRNTIFRPRFAAGQPVATEKRVKAYDVTQQ
jgi:tetratricopeptide (TPR) repeat protein